VFIPALSQAIRSALFSLIPTTLITLISWAFAGSTYANTSDPIRAGVWLFLGAHQVPMQLQLPPSDEAGLMTYFPLGALALPLWAIYFGAKKLKNLTNNSTSARNIFIFAYASILGILALLSGNNDVRPIWYWAVGLGVLLALIATYFSAGTIKYTAPVILTFKIWALLLGLSAIITAIALIAHQRTVEQIYTVLDPGIIGGFFLSLLNILYIPNYLISTLSYFVGTGFAIGRDTLISPLTYNLGEVPALPILAAVPTGSHPLYLIGAILMPILGGALVIWSDTGNSVLLRQTLILFSLSTFVVAYLGSGSLVTDQLGTIGVSVWKFPLFLIGEILIGVLVMKLLPLISFARRRHEKGN